MTHVIVGGGLAGGLVALALAQAGRGRGLTLVEQGQRLGGNHTWSFHETDLDAEGSALLAPLLCRQWPGQRVRFPGRERIFVSGYASVTSDRFADLLAARLEQAGARVVLGRRVAAVEARAVHLDDGTALRASVVLDARGPEAAPPARRLGFQKFLGLELELGADGPWADPVLMDATVPQRDGYRFVYVLPFSPRRVLIEDTIYSGNARLDAFELERRILAYAAEHGAHVTRVLRRETGVLALPLGEAAAEPNDPRQEAPIAVGYRGGFFHPVTGYSLPLAARVAVAVAKARTAAETREAVRGLFRELAPQRRFGHLLNRLMFDAMPPAARWTALDRFYRLPEPTIARFYASRSTLLDRARILLGRPPAGLSWKHLWRPRAEMA
ncbi:MAG TPA: lycopene beta-cyclase CrtY [Polyangia bacterium]|nr:lycopene beta-cyclase CrtY [Polyangia bacterium]